MHAPGQEGFNEKLVLFDGAMATGAIRKSLLVFPSGSCCYRPASTGETVCTEAGGDSAKDPDLVRLCRSGTFFVDAAGTGDGDDVSYGRSFFELMDEVDARWRTLK